MERVVYWIKSFMDEYQEHFVCVLLNDDICAIILDTDIILSR